MTVVSAYEKLSVQLKMRPTRLYYEKGLRRTAISLNYDRTYDGIFAIIVRNVHVRKGCSFVNLCSLYIRRKQCVYGM